MVEHSEHTFYNGDNITFKIGVELNVPNYERKDRKSHS
jgi:hypothetical protein